MKSCLIFILALLLGTIAAGRADTVELTGMASFFGQKMALLTISQSAQTKPASITLTEGESSNGIQLLAMDFARRNVQILNAGQRQTLHICSPATGTEVVAAGRVAANGVTIYRADGTYEFQATPPTRAAAMAGQADFFSGCAAGATTPGADSSTPSQDDNTSDGNLPAPKRSKTYQWWVKEAEKIERARNETAARVKAGEWQPYPRTPLTPANTPAELVSADEVFMGHGPGVIVQ